MYGSGRLTNSAARTNVALLIRRAVRPHEEGIPSSELPGWMVRFWLLETAWRDKKVELARGIEPPTCGLQKPVQLDFLEAESPRQKPEPQDSSRE